MRKTLGLLMMLFSLYAFAGTAVGEVEADEVIDVELEKGNSDKEDRHPRTLTPFTCVYTDGIVQLTLFGEIGDYTLTVTNQLTGERWFAVNAIVLPISTASGVYEVQIVTEDGSMYYGTYVLQ